MSSTKDKGLYEMDTPINGHSRGETHLVDLWLQDTWHGEIVEYQLPPRESAGLVTTSA